MKHLPKLTFVLITMTLVGCQKIPFLNETPEPNQSDFTARPPGTPLNKSALNRLSKAISIEVVTQSFLTGGNQFIPLGSGVIIAKKGSIDTGFTYYVLTANHISDSDEGNLAFIRNEKPGEMGEILPLKVIKRYPKEDLAVLAFLSFKDYRVVELGEAGKLNNNSEVYVTGWPGRENRQGFQFTPAEVTNPQAGDNLTYEPVESGEDVYKGMSGGAVLNEAGQLVGIHVGLTRLGGDGKGVLISTFLGMAPPEFQEALPKTSPVASPSPPPPVPTPVASPSPVAPPPPTISNSTNIAEVRTLTGHSGGICLDDCLAISPDGRTVVSGSWDDTIKVWDLATGSLKATLTGHSNSVYSVAISPDGRTVVSGGYDTTIKVWDLATGSLKATLTGHSNNVNSVAISPDGRTVVSGSGDDTIKVWDLGTGSLKATLTGHGSSVLSVAISPDGRTVVSGSVDDTIKVWDLGTGSLKATLTGHSSYVLSVAISPDGRTVVSGSYDDTIKVWDLGTGSLKATLTDHSNWVRSVAISPDGRTVVSGSGDDTIKVWDLATGSLKATLTGHSNNVNSVAISPDGRTIVSGSGDNTIKVWSAR